MDGHRKSWMRSRASWIAVMATLVIVPAASADDDWDDDDRDDDERWYNTYEHSPWNDPGRQYDRHGSFDPYGYGHGYWPASGPYPEFDSLYGYGSWQQVPGFGGPVWFPYVAASWRPYFYGHWVSTRFGMTWVSYEPWGDIPHHYGHWVWVDHYGWGWVPGWEYRPAWVTFGVVDGYIGWAPLPPPGYRYPRYCHYSPGRHHPDYRWSASFAYDSSGLDFGLWVFVSDNHFYGSSVHSHAVPVRNTLSFFKEKRVLPVGRDLHVDYVKRVSPAPVRTVELTQRSKSVGGRTLVFQEPRGQESKIRAGREATQRIVTKVEDPRGQERTEKSRSGSVSQRSPSAPERPEVVTGKSPAAGQSSPEVVAEKSRGAAPSRSDVVAEKSAPAVKEAKEEKSGKGQEQKEKRKR